MAPAVWLEITAQIISSSLKAPDVPFKQWLLMVVIRARGKGGQLGQVELKTLSGSDVHLLGRFIVLWVSLDLSLSCPELQNHKWQQEQWEMWVAKWR